jgi:hypothetical protein
MPMVKRDCVVLLLLLASACSGDGTTTTAPTTTLASSPTPRMGTPVRFQLPQELK